MSSPLDYLRLSEHLDIVDEYNALESNEDRLSWLVERSPLHTPVPNELLTPERRVPGCLSGLWLHGEVSEGRCLFSAKSDSDMVQGITSFICDLYSNRPPSEVMQIGGSLADVLGLERLLSTTRRRAVGSTVSYIVYTARVASQTEV